MNKSSAVGKIQNKWCKFVSLTFAYPCNVSPEWAKGWKFIKKNTVSVPHKAFIASHHNGSWIPVFLISLHLSSLHKNYWSVITSRFYWCRRSWKVVPRRFSQFSLMITDTAVCWEQNDQVLARSFVPVPHCDHRYGEPTWAHWSGSLRYCRSTSAKFVWRFSHDDWFHLPRLS